MAQLGNLCPEQADEAKALIPSLEHKIPNEELNELLAQLAANKQFST